MHACTHAHAHAHAHRDREVQKNSWQKTIDLKIHLSFCKLHYSIINIRLLKSENHWPTASGLCILESVIHIRGTFCSVSHHKHFVQYSVINYSIVLCGPKCKFLLAEHKKHVCHCFPYCTLRWWHFRSIADLYFISIWFTFGLHLVYIWVSSWHVNVVLSQA